MARSSSKRKPSAPEDGGSIAADLNYSEAQTALELTLAQLQSPELPVEAMTDLYQRARSYAARCEQLLNQVEQSVTLWDPETPEAPARDYKP